MGWHIIVYYDAMYSFLLIILARKRAVHEEVLFGVVYGCFLSYLVIQGTIYI